MTFGKQLHQTASFLWRGGRAQKGQKSRGTKARALRPPRTKRAVKVAPLPPACGGRRRSRCPRFSPRRTKQASPARPPPPALNTTVRRPDPSPPASARSPEGMRGRRPPHRCPPCRVCPSRPRSFSYPHLCPPRRALTRLRAPQAAGRGRRRRSPRRPGEPRCWRRPPPGCFSPHGSPSAHAAEGPRRAGCCGRRAAAAAAASLSSCPRLMCPPFPVSPPGPPLQLPALQRRPRTPASPSRRAGGGGARAAATGCSPWGSSTRLYPGYGTSSAGGAAGTPKGMRHRPPPPPLGGQREGDCQRRPHGGH